MIAHVYISTGIVPLGFHGLSGYAHDDSTCLSTGNVLLVVGFHGLSGYAHAWYGIVRQSILILMHMTCAFKVASFGMLNDKKLLMSRALGLAWERCV